MADDNQDIEREARNMGWVPEDEFRGNKEHWVDAAAFVERGRQVLPILVQNNKRLQKELLTRDQKIGNLETSLEQQQALLESLEDRYGQITKQAVADAKARLKAELKSAREDDDLDKELDIQEQLRTLDDVKPTEKPVKKDPPAKKKEEALSPEFQQWYSDNPWFGQDKKKTREILRVAEDLRDEGNTLEGVEFMEECARVLAERQGHSRKDDNDGTPVSRVESGSSRGRSSGGKSFSDLPAEAKKACWEDIDELVGEGKRYKTQKDWEAAYAKVYFGS